MNIPGMFLDSKETTSESYGTSKPCLWTETKFG